MGGESQPERPNSGLLGVAPGTLVAGYRVESRIGVGGMAMVFRARDESLGRTVALKVLAPALADDADFRERFIRESRAAAVVDHPHIIPVYGAGEFEGVLYLAMRYVAGGDLRALLRREGQLSPSRAAFLLSPLASALDAGHAAGLVHRDVKPANILIDTSPGRPDHLYLSDFGLAKGNATTGLTGTGQFLGTLDYCAPEQIGAKPARPQTDQYALGCVAYTMFTGKVPFPRDEVTAVLWAHMSEPPPSVTELRPDLPSALDQVLARAMAKDPDKRYPTCTEFAEAVRAALGVDAYTTPSSVYTAAGKGLPPDPDGGLAGPASAVLSVPVPPSPISTPPAAPGPAVPPLEAAAPGPPVPPHAPTQSGSSLGLADTAGRTIPPPGRSPMSEISPRQAADPAGRRQRRRVMLAAAAVVAAGGATAAVLTLSPPGRPPAGSASSPPPTSASNPPASTAGTSPPALAALTEPDGAVPSDVAFSSGGTLITIDKASAYSWDITKGSHTRADYGSAQALAAAQQPVGGGLQIAAGSPENVTQVWSTASGQIVATLVAPKGTAAYAYALSPDGTEAAVADSNGKTYVWKIAS